MELSFSDANLTTRVELCETSVSSRPAVSVTTDHARCRASSGAPQRSADRVDRQHQRSAQPINANPMSGRSDQRRIRSSVSPIRDNPQQQPIRPASDDAVCGPRRPARLHKRRALPGGNSGRHAVRGNSAGAVVGAAASAVMGAAAGAGVGNEEPGADAARSGPRRAAARKDAAATGTISPRSSTCCRHIATSIRGRSCPTASRRRPTT